MPSLAALRCHGYLFPPVRTSVLLLVMVAATSAYAFEETSRYKEVDAGVHIPVLTRAPTLVTFVEAEYPPEMEAQGVTARVRLAVTINADGGVGNIKVIEPVGNGFDEAAVAAVQQFVFTPAEVDFVPATVQIEYVYNFVLKPPPEDAGVPEEPDAGGAPDATLTGVLNIRGARGFVPGAIVRCDNNDELEAYSDEEGRFTLQVFSGPCEVRVASSEYELFKTQETLEPGETREVKFYLVPKLVGFSTTVRDVKDKKEVVKRTITRAEAQRVPGTFGDPIRVIQNFPGVARAPFGLGQLIVRGANPNQTLTYFDGVEIPLLFHLAGGPSVVNGEFLDRIDFFPGGFGARYGRAVGGVVDVGSRKGASDTWHGVAKVDLLDASLFAEAPLAKDVSVAVAARRSYIDALMPLILNLAVPKDPEGGTIQALPVYWDYQARLDVGGKKGEKLEDGKSRFSLFAFGSDDQMKLVSTGGGRNVDVTINFHTSFHRLIGSWDYKQGNTTFKLTPYLGYDLVNISFGGSQGGLDQFNAGLRADVAHEFNPIFTLRGGMDIYYRLLVGRAQLPGLEVQYVPFPGADAKSDPWSVAMTIPQFDGALYTEGDINIGKFTATPGVRLSHAVINGQVRDTADPRLWLRFQPLDALAIKGSVGLYSQPPAGFNMVAAPLGNPNLLYERAFQSSLGVAYKFTEFINADVTGFFNRRYDLIVSPGTTTVNQDGSLTRTLSANQGLGRAYGLEVMLRHEVSKYFFGWVAYTFNRSEEARADDGKPYHVSDFDQTHILTVVGSVNLPWGFIFGARFRYVTGRPKTAVIHPYDVQQIDSYSFSPTMGPVNGSRVEDFHQLDLRLEKIFAFKEWSLSVYLDVQNVYNKQNVEGTFFDYRYRQEYIVPGIPVLPVLGIKASL